METWIYYGIALFTLWAAGFMAFHLFYRRKYTQKLVDLYKKVELSEASARRIKEQFLKIQEEASSLRLSLDRERRERTEETAGQRENYRKKTFAFSAACLFSGLLFGGLVSGLLVHSAGEVSHVRKMIDLEVLAKVNEAKAEMLRLQLDKVQANYDLLHRSLTQTRENEAVTLAKLEVLLEHLSGRKLGQKLMLDIEAMRESLRNNFNSADLPSERFMLQNAAAI